MRRSGFLFLFVLVFAFVAVLFFVGKPACAAGGTASPVLSSSTSSGGSAGVSTPVFPRLSVDEVQFHPEFLYGGVSSSPSVSSDGEGLQTSQQSHSSEPVPAEQATPSSASDRSDQESTGDSDTDTSSSGSSDSSASDASDASSTSDADGSQESSSASQTSPAEDSGGTGDSSRAEGSSTSPPRFVEGMEISSVVTEEDVPASVSLYDRFTDDDTSPTEMKYYAFAEDGVVASISDGVMTITPEPNWHGDTSVTLVVVDVDGLSFTTEIAVSVLSVDDPPVLVDDSLSSVEVSQGSTATFVLSEYFSDPDSEISYGVGASRVVSVSVSDGVLVISPPWTWYGEDSFVLTASDGVYSVSVVVNVDVSPNWVSVHEPVESHPDDMPRTVDVEKMVGEPLEVEEISAVSDNPHVKVRVNPDHTITIIPEEGWTGSANVKVTVKASTGQVGNIEIPVVVSEKIRPVVSWVYTYLVGLVLGGVFVSARLYGTYRAFLRSFPSPVVLENYRHFRGRGNS